jgi:hypothetical protein
MARPASEWIKDPAKAKATEKMKEEYVAAADAAAAKARSMGATEEQLAEWMGPMNPLPRRT